jgi:hypothetical protein
MNSVICSFHLLLVNAFCTVYVAARLNSDYRENKLLKWFYDTFTGVATGAARYGSFTGKAFSLFGCSLWMNAVDMMIYVVRVV